MSRITKVFNQLHIDKRVALIPFITAGDPQPNITVPLMHTMVESGADLIELGIPFSDPMADGPIIQRASERALAHGITLHDCIKMVQEFRIQNTVTPVVLMGYLNPIESMGYEIFANSAAESGVDGVLIVDAPPEESSELLTSLRNQFIDPIYLLAPTSTEERIQRICNAASGFVYYVSIKGVTGASHLDIAAVENRLHTIRKFTRLPLGVGFGIHDSATAARLAQIADAVIVGSAIVKRIEELQTQPAAILTAIAKFLDSLRFALNTVTKPNPITILL
jgi:tryptophan synthase alpha chain